MHVIQFPEVNRIWKAPEGMENCVDLPCFQDEQLVVSCLKMTWRERFSALIFGKCWHFAYTQQPYPVAMIAKRNVFEKVGE